MQAPETRPSLILRLRNLDDVQAWNEFTEIYEPLVFRLARKLGMQHAAALEAKQEVLLHLAKAIESWQPQTGGTFRGWLYRVARNVMLRHAERAVSLAPNNAQSHLKLAVALQETDAREKALPHLERAIALEPESYSGYYRRGNYYRAVGADAQAITPIRIVHVSDENSVPFQILIDRFHRYFMRAPHEVGL